MAKNLRRLACICTATWLPAVHAADVLLAGSAAVDDETRLEFSLTGESRENVVGGSITLGEQAFEITNVSVHNLIGASGRQGDIHQFAVFSSSFSRNTATGQPWIAGENYLQCDQPYNSFLAVYSVGSDERKQLSALPFKELTENLDASSQSVVYCFISSPPDR